MLYFSINNWTKLLVCTFFVVFIPVLGFADAHILCKRSLSMALGTLLHWDAISYRHN